MSDHHHSDHAPHNSFTSDQDFLLVRAVAGDLDALDDVPDVNIGLPNPQRNGHHGSIPHIRRTLG